MVITTGVLSTLMAGGPPPTVGGLSVRSPEAGTKAGTKDGMGSSVINAAEEMAWWRLALATCCGARTTAEMSGSDAACQTDEVAPEPGSIQYIVIKSHTMHYLQAGDEFPKAANGYEGTNATYGTNETEDANGVREVEVANENEDTNESEGTNDMRVCEKLGSQQHDTSATEWPGSADEATTESDSGYGYLHDSNDEEYWAAAALAAAALDGGTKGGDGGGSGGSIRQQQQWQRQQHEGTKLDADWDGDESEVSDELDWEWLAAWRDESRSSSCSNNKGHSLFHNKEAVCPRVDVRRRIGDFLFRLARTLDVVSNTSGSDEEREESLLHLRETFYKGEIMDIVMAVTVADLAAEEGEESAGALLCFLFEILRVRLRNESDRKTLKMDQAAGVDVEEWILDLGAEALRAA